MNIMIVFKSFKFEAAHYLPNVPDGHKCKRLHGHSFRVVIHASGEVDADVGWVIDFADIKKAFDPILTELDHHYLNEIPGLENPTSENIARYLWKRLSSNLPQLHQIDVHETCNAGCTYQGE